MKFHHLGIACNNIEETLTFVKKVHHVLNVSEVVYDPFQEASLCMVTVEDGSNIELITGRAVENLLKKRISLYHVCYEVDRLNEAIELFLKNGAVMISAPKKTVLFNGKKVAFLHTPIGIVELLERVESHD